MTTLKEKRYETIIRIQSDARTDEDAEDKAWEFLVNADRRDIQFITALTCSPGKWRNPNTGKCEERKLLGW